jgi:glycosyltransferase involved in cell wall biosynthesis
VGDQRFVVTTHYHGGSASSVRDRLLSLYRPFGQWAVRRADEVIAVSEWEQERLREDFDVEATVIPNGVDIGRFSDAEPERRDRPYLLCVGRLEEYKGVQHVVRALTELREYDLVVAGSGPYRDELERIAREADVSDRVDFLGYVDDERIPRLYAGATVYLALSKFEAYGMTVSEALSAETPCVVREAGALQDWVRRDGVIGVSKPTPLEVSAAVRSVVGGSPSGSISTWNDVVVRLVDIYAELTERNCKTKHGRDMSEKDDPLSDDID